MVKVWFDTSVLVAALVADHAKHFESLPWLQRVKAEEIQGFVSTHTLAELYAVLTRLPLPQQISPMLAQRLLIENLNKFQKVILTPEDYQATIVKAVKLNIFGGGILRWVDCQGCIESES